MSVRGNIGAHASLRSARLPERIAARPEWMSALTRLSVWYRARRRRQKILWRLRHADVVVVTHAKSGRTWLLVMISHLFHLKYGTPAEEIIKFDNLHRLEPRIPKLYFTRFTGLAPDADGRRSCNLDPATKLIFLFRDPRDIAVSYYFHLRNRSTAVERAHKAVSDAAVAKPIFDFVVDDAVGLPRIIRLMNRWLDEMAALDHAILVRYEDLHADPIAELRRVMAFVGILAADAELERAVEFASFANLQESRGGAVLRDRASAADRQRRSGRVQSTPRQGRRLSRLLQRRAARGAGRPGRGGAEPASGLSWRAIAGVVSCSSHTTVRRRKRGIVLSMKQVER